MNFVIETAHWTDEQQSVHCAQYTHGTCAKTILILILFAVFFSARDE